MIAMSTALCIVFCAALGQSTMGFGGGLIAIPLLSLILPVQDAVMLGLVLQLMVGFLAFKAVRSLRWSVLWPMLLPIAPATWLGMHLLQSVNDSMLRVGLASFILLFLLKTRFWPDVRIIPSGHWIWAVSASALGGLIQGTIGTGGPPFVIYFNETMDDKDLIRASLLLILMSCNILRLFVAIPKGLFHPALMEWVYWAIPCIVLAMFAGHHLHSKVNESMYRKAVQLLLLGSSVSLLLKAF